MYSIIYNLYFLSKRLGDRTLGKTTIFCRIINKILRSFFKYADYFFTSKISNRFSNCNGNQIGVTKKKRKQKIIVSLTSFPARIDTVHIVIETIMRQSIKADEIILWLAKSQFDGMDSLPKQLSRLVKRGLQIRFCDDLRSHKKYYYTFIEYPNDMVVTLDDDIFYPYDTIAQLYKLHKKYPEDIVCISAAKITDFNKLPSEWENFDKNEVVISSSLAQAYTGAGAMFIPNKFDKILYDKNIINNLCPYADDLWIYYVGHISGICVSKMKKYRVFPMSIPSTSENSLFRINGKNGGNMNDVQWQRLLDIKRNI